MILRNRDGLLEPVGRWTKLIEPYSVDDAAVSCKREYVCTYERTSVLPFSIFFSPFPIPPPAFLDESDPSRERHSTLRELHRSATLSIDWRFSSGRFWRSTFRRRSHRHTPSFYISPFHGSEAEARGPRTDVTDSTSVKKANTKPISSPRSTSPAAPPLVYAWSLPVSHPHTRCWQQQ